MERGWQRRPATIATAPRVDRGYPTVAPANARGKGAHAVRRMRRCAAWVGCVLAGLLSGVAGRAAAQDASGQTVRPLEPVASESAPAQSQPTTKPQVPERAPSFELPLDQPAESTPAEPAPAEDATPGVEPLMPPEPGLTALLPDAISSDDITLSGRFVRQWKQADGELTLMFNGGFALEMNRRRLSADDAVVWIRSQTAEGDTRRHFELTVYLSGNAEIRDSGGTTTQDTVLLVRNLRTYGRISKEHDAHSPEAMENSNFYRRALLDRLRVEELREQAGVSGDQVDVARPGELTGPQRPPPMIRYDVGRIEPGETPDGESVFVAGGRVYFARTGDPDSPVLEITADQAVVFPAPGVTGSILSQTGLSDETAASQPADEGRPRANAPPGTFEGERNKLQSQLRAVYLEGDVVLSFGDRFVRADRLYYDFELDRALILDAVLRADIPQRGIPLYVRAAEIRQLSAREFSASRALVTTSEFHTPHYHMGAEKVYLLDRTPRDAGGRPAAEIAGTFEATHTTLNVENVPIAWWPYSRGDFQSSETLIRRLRTGYSDEFGLEFESYWYLFQLLGLERPAGFDATLELDYFGERGPGVGVDVDYERQDYLGLLRTFYINDGDEDNFGPLRDNTPDSANRGRVLWRHRQYLPNDWEISFELAYVSDPGFLETYETSEWFEGKQQETAVYLKRARDVDAVTLLTNWRMLDFVTQTEHLPELAYRRIGDTFLSPLVLYHESRIGGVRYRPDDRYFFDQRPFRNDGLTDLTARIDGREEADLPLKLGGANVAPFATLRGTYWDGQPLDEGGLWRGIGVYGLRGAAEVSRVYNEVRSELFDVDRIRHIVRPEFLAWWSHSNARSDQITTFDEGIETIDDFYGVGMALRQTWQTKRGAGLRRRTVDLLTFDLEAGFFGDRQNENSNGYVNFARPEDSRTRNHIAGDLRYRLSDTTSLLYDFNIDTNNWSSDRQNVSLAVERLPRLAYVFGWRHAGDIDLDLIGGGYNYKINEKHITALRVWYDLDRTQLGEISVSYVRHLPRWYFALNFEVDEVLDDVSISVSLWPEGIPEWTLGSRRFTGLSTTTGIRP